MHTRIRLPILVDVLLNLVAFSVYRAFAMPLPSVSQATLREHHILVLSGHPSSIALVVIDCLAATGFVLIGFGIGRNYRIAPNQPLHLTCYTWGHLERDCRVHGNNALNQYRAAFAGR